ncbi:DUF3581 family protein [Lamprobacter modestohalophilus]|uniref:DUF3581 family protein n=1 Tax=Lamprobacter modestohalophilus TaxID=1064514 RepID=UPI003B84811A
MNERLSRWDAEDPDVSRSLSRQPKTARSAFPHRSAFTKQIASDDNPIHDATHPRMCIPGDVLFAQLVLARCGLSLHWNSRRGGRVGRLVPSVGRRPRFHPHRSLGGLVSAAETPSIKARSSP